MKKNVSIRMFCMLLAVVLLFSLLPLTVVAVDDVVLPEVTPSTEENVILPSESLIAEQTTEETTFFVPGPGELSYAQLQTATLAAADIPEVIPLAKVEEKQHVNRLYVQETDLHTIKFQNRDGSKTDYIFKNPVKYVAEDGSVRDISTQPVAGKYALRGKTYAYALTDHSMHQYFPAQIQNGVLVEVNGHYVQMVPQSTYTSLIVQTAKMQNNVLLYEDVFGAGIDIRYTPVSSGLKEDIVLASYTGVRSFSFLFRTNGLFMTEMEGEYHLTDENGMPCASLGKVLVYDSAMHYTCGEMTVTALSAGNTYRVTLTVDEAFLRSPDTVYPVTVDPTIGETAYSYTQGTVNMIEDYGLYKDGMTSYTDEYHLLGWLEDREVYGCIGRVVYKFPFFHAGGNALSVNYTRYSGANIGSVKLNVYAGGIDTANVKIYPLTQSWSFSANAIENDTYWNQTLSTTHMITGTLDAYSDYNTLDITKIFRKWADYNAGDTNKPNPAYGLILVNENETTTDNVWILSTTEYAQHNTYLELDYETVGGTYYLCNGSTGKLARANRAGPPRAICYNETDNFEWFFQYMGDGEYLITSQYGSSLCVNNNQLVVGNTSFGGVTDAYLWKFVASQMGGSRIQNVATGLHLYHTEDSTTTQMSVVTARAATADDYYNTTWYIAHEYTPLTDFSLSEEHLMLPRMGTMQTRQLSLDIEGGNDIWNEARHFNWSVSAPTFSITSNYYTSGRLTIPAGGGETTLTVEHKTTGITKTYSLTCSEIWSDRDYFVRNVGSEFFMKITDGSTANGALLEQNVLNEDSLACTRFRFIPVGLNTYQIQAVHSQKYLIASADGNSIYQNDLNETDLGRWEITITQSGRANRVSQVNGIDCTDHGVSETYRAYRISPVNSNYAMAMSSDKLSKYSAGAKVTLLGESNNYGDEWNLVQMLPTSQQKPIWFDPEDTSNPEGYVCWESNEDIYKTPYPNCYAYALDVYNVPNDALTAFPIGQVSQTLQPGALAGCPYAQCECQNCQEAELCCKVLCGVLRDAFAKGFNFEQIGKYDECSAGMYKIALVRKGNDYHWYRQDSNGFWSHKLDNDEASNTDLRGNFIIDPEYCRRVDDQGAGYMYFIGYFAVSVPVL